MTHLSDAALARLRAIDDVPRLDGDRYELREELGRGGMGVVYRAVDRELQRDVAIKVVASARIDGDSAARLLREARALARLEHPGIVPVHDVGTVTDGRVFYAMKLVRGERLDRRLARGVTLGEGLRLFARICDAVGFAHAAGVIHRDLKPQNVMVGAFGDVLVLDWGVAKVRATEVPEPSRGVTPAGAIAAGGQDPETGDGTVLGTPGYMAPEQASGEVRQVDERTDVYSLGVVLREVALAGSGGRVPPALRSIIAMATEPPIARRYPSVRDLALDVERFVDRAPVVAHRESLLERLGRLAARHRTAVALVAVYVVVRVILLAVWRI
jgi:serine/threonine protein kinase